MDPILSQQYSNVLPDNSGTTVPPDDTHSGLSNPQLEQERDRDCVHCSRMTTTQYIYSSHVETITTSDDSLTETESMEITRPTTTYYDSESTNVQPTDTKLSTAILPQTSETTNIYTMNSIQSSESNEFDGYLNSNTTSNYFSISISNNAMANPYALMVGKVHHTGYLLLVLLIALPVFIVICAAVHNSRFKGSDAPNFSAMLKCALTTADLYTDIIFCVLLLFKLNTTLFIPCMVFIAISHMISNVIGVHYIRKWKHKSVDYIQQYHILVGMLSAIVGFYAAIQLLSSKLFYFKPFSMQLSNAQMYRIQVLTICNDVLFRNIPLIIIQLLNIFTNDMDFVTAIAFISTLFMLITGSLTLFSRSITTRCHFKYHFNEKNIALNVTLSSDTFQLHHQFCHSVIAECVAISLGIAPDRVETILVTPIYNGISCEIEILLVADEQKVYQTINDLQNNWQSTMCKFKSTLCKALYIMETNVNIEIMEHKEETQNIENSYKTMPQTFREIEIVQVCQVMSRSSSLNDHMLELNTTDIEIKYNEESES